MRKEFFAVVVVGLASLLLVLGVAVGLRTPVVQAMERGMGMRDRGMRSPVIRDPGMYAPAPPRQERAYRSPFDLAFSPDGRRLAVSDRTAGCLYLFDAQTGDLARTVPLRGRPSGLAWESNEKIAICEYDAGSVAEVNTDTGQILRRFFVGPKPIGVAVAPGKGALVVCDFGLHTISIVDLKTAAVRGPIPGGKHPSCVAITPDERTAVVANLLPSGPAVEHTSAAVVSLIDIDSGTKIADVPLPDNSGNVRQVRVSPDGRWAYLVHTRGRTMLPTTQLDRGWINTNAMSIIDLGSGRATGRDTDTHGPAQTNTDSASRERPVFSGNDDAGPATVALRRGQVRFDSGWQRQAESSQLADGFSNSRDHRQAASNREKRAFGAPLPLPPGNGLSESAAGHGGPCPALYATVLLDTVTEGAADPWGIALSPDGRTAWISIAGGHEIARLELARLHRLLAGQPEESDAVAQAGDATAIWRQIRDDPAKREQLSYHLSALYAAGLLSRVPIAAKGPRAIVMSPDGRQIMVASYYSGEVLSIDPNDCHVLKRIGLGPQPAPDVVRHGEFVFHDARHCFQHWLSCASCHPDGRADGMNWDLLNDGIGNPKNVHSLLWAHRTPPLMSLGIREDMQEATQKGFEFVQFREIDEGDLNATRAFIRSMEPEPSPHLVNGELSEKARKGRKIFEDASVGCSACHPAPLFTSLKTHDVGTRSALDRSGAFDTPTCVELWRTGPYLHDGSAVTLKDVVRTKNPNDKHGRTSHLSDDEIDALVEYLLSL